MEDLGDKTANKAATVAAKPRHSRNLRESETGSDQFIDITKYF